MNNDHPLSSAGQHPRPETDYAPFSVIPEAVGDANRWHLLYGPTGTFPTRFQMAPSTLGDVSGAIIETRPGVRSGKPCFVGTRVAVYDVLDYLASGMTTEEIVADFPELTPLHVRAALEFAATRERRLASA